MRVALAGKGRLGAALMRGLLGSQHEVVGWVGDGRRWRRPARPVVSRVQRVFEPGSAPGLAVRHRIPRVWLEGDPERDAAAIAALDADVLLSGDFGMILPRPVLAAPRVGCVNVHWSLLPRHRGPCPSTSVLLAGDPETGVTFHVTTPRIDAGDILHQESFPVGPMDTAFSLYARAAEHAERAVAGVVDRIDRHGLVGSPQDVEAGSYGRRPRREDLQLDWSRPAEELDRIVRACVSPMPWFPWRGNVVHVSHSALVDGSGPPGTVLGDRPRVTVATGTGGLLIDVAYAWRPVPWLWPAPWDRPRVGTVLSGRAPGG